MKSNRIWLNFCPNSVGSLEVRVPIVAQDYAIKVLSLHQKSNLKVHKISDNYPIDDLNNRTSIIDVVPCYYDKSRLIWGFRRQKTDQKNENKKL